MSTFVPSTYPPARFIGSLGDYLTVDELAEYLQLSKETIYHWGLEGTGPKAPKLGKQLRYSADFGLRLADGSPLRRRFVSSRCTPL